jgi:hypothetical protein
MMICGFFGAYLLTFVMPTALGVGAFKGQWVGGMTFLLGSPDGCLGRAIIFC